MTNPLVCTVLAPHVFLVFMTNAIMLGGVVLCADAPLSAPAK